MFSNPRHRPARAKQPARRILAVVLALCAAVATAHGQVECSDAVSGAGYACCYDYPGSGACYFSHLGEDAYVAAMSPADYNGSAMCGRYIRVTGPLGWVDVQVADESLLIGPGDIDLNCPAFAQIGAVGMGPVAVTWRTIASPDSSPISLYIYDGSNPWWMGIQVRNHRYGVAALEYLGPSGYVSVPRSMYNFFIVDGTQGVPTPFADPFAVRLTDVNGQVVEVGGIPLSSGTEVATGVQFAICGESTAVGPPSRRPSGFVMYDPIPNPFNPRTTIKYDLPESGPVRLSVFDLAGRLVRTLVDESKPQGSFEAVWDGRDSTGKEVGSGTYLARLDFGGRVEVVRMGLVR